MISCYDLTIPGAEATGPLLEEVSFEIGDAEWVEFVGPSGAGKSILYAVLALEARPSEGRLVVAGRNLSRVDESGLVELRREFGSCRQSPDLLESRTVVENLVVPLVVRGKTTQASSAADRVLERVDLAEMRDVPVARLSTGHRRAVALLRATMGRPRAIVIDGTLEGLDHKLFEAARAALHRSHDQGSAIVLFGREPSENAPVDRCVYRLEGGTLDEGTE
ncbi:MAG: ATP-binding cassette domain-containing protein [Bradymonadaceae bacterium]